MDIITLSLDEVARLTDRVLRANGVSADQAGAITRTIVAAERDHCQSHGMYRLLGYVRIIRAGYADLDAVPTSSDIAPSLLRVDAAKGFAPLAFERGMPALIEKAERQGIAAMAINRCFHFSALWAEVEPLAEAGLVSLAFTPSHSWVAPAGGSKPLFGTNPIAFGWPRPGGEPYVFDFATSAIARGEIELHRRAGKPIPEGWAVDRQGNPTTDAAAALEGAMLTFGGHKGSALATMVELVAGPLIGDLLSSESQEFDADVGGPPYHGELIIAISPRSFLGETLAPNLDRAESLFDSVSEQGARLPSQRRYQARRVTPTEGVAVPRALHDELLALIETAGSPASFMAK